MARPRRKRAEIDAALVSAELLLRHVLRSCGDFSLASREGTECLVELIEALALAMVSPQKLISAEEQQILEMAEQFVERQLEKLRQQGLAFASPQGVRAFFLSQLFERLRQEVSASKKEQFERRASGAYFTPIGLSYYLVQTAFSSAQSGCQNLRILDFCAGSGCLSIAALDYLESSSSSSLLETERLSLLRKHIFAVEIDPLILRTYIACLAVACSSTV
ncbi:MAG: Methylase, partial [Cyanobacteriota bacterium erpe_2018_sw_21hr_WHONDRS-SW48-000092_B_bin.40]|nr:Methylase [Cyanobacteriota bacterium erpe_2018_sw_21hr_WHONDRS-SW48-000092_B_bin.40]